MVVLSLEFLILDDELLSHLLLSLPLALVELHHSELDIGDDDVLMIRFGLSLVRVLGDDCLCGTDGLLDRKSTVDLGHLGLCMPLLFWLACALESKFGSEDNLRWRPIDYRKEVHTVLFPVIHYILYFATGFITVVYTLHNK